jgi:hypothetical protein
VLRPLAGGLVLAVVLGACASTPDQPTSVGAPVSLGTPSTPSTPATPQAGESLLVEASRFQVVYRLEGTSESSTKVGIDIPQGLIFRPARASGSVVATSDQLGRRELPPGLRAQLTKDAAKSSIAASRFRALSQREGPATAAVPGVVTLSSTEVAIASAGIDAVAPLSPLQELRYRGFGFTAEASVETILGQRTVPCQAVWLGPRSAAAQPGDAGGGSRAVHCRLSADVETAAGLPVLVTLRSPVIPDAVVVPSRYIGLDSASASYVVTARVGGALLKRSVIVGPTDGVRRLIVSGVKPGTVLEPFEDL